jgi:hypothetical protein
MNRTYTLLADDTKKDLQRALKSGRTFSCNNSPTCQARIKEIVGGYCVLEVVASPESYMKSYNKKYADKIGTTFKVPGYITWNAIYY